MRRIAILLGLLGAVPGYGADVEFTWVSSSNESDHRSTTDVNGYIVSSSPYASDNPSEITDEDNDPDDLPSGGHTNSLTTNPDDTAHSSAVGTMTVSTNTNAQADSYGPWVVTNIDVNATLEADGSPARDTVCQIESNTSAKSHDKYDLPSTDVGTVDVRGAVTVICDGGSGNESTIPYTWQSITQHKAKAYAKVNGGGSLATVNIYYLQSAGDSWYITRSGKSGTPASTYKAWGSSFTLSADDTLDYEHSYPRFEIQANVEDRPVLLSRGYYTPSEVSVGWDIETKAQLSATN